MKPLVEDLFAVCEREEIPFFVQFQLARTRRRATGTCWLPPWGHKRLHLAALLLQAQTTEEIATVLALFLEVMECEKNERPG